MLFEPTLKLSGLLAKPQTNLKEHIAPTLNSRQTSATQKPFTTKLYADDTDTFNQP
jgi:hypothetical protein